MSVSNIVYCPICTEYFHATSNIYTTSCGHVYHYGCLNDWLSRSKTCPQCMSKNPTTHKIYLNFEVDDDNKKLKLRIEELNKKIGQSEENFLSLQRQYTESDDLIKKLHDDIQILKIESEFKAIEIAKVQFESSNQIKMFERKLKDLSTELEKEVTKNVQLSADIQILKTNGEFKDIEIAKVQFQSSNQIKMFERKLKDLSTELEKEITKNDQLSADIQILKIESEFKDMEITKVQLESSDQIKMFEQKLKDLSTELQKEVTKNVQLSTDIKMLKLDSAFKDLEIVKVQLKCADQIQMFKLSKNAQFRDDFENEITKNSQFPPEIMQYIKSDELLQTRQDDIKMLKNGSEMKDIELNEIGIRLESADQNQITTLENMTKISNEIGFNQILELSEQLLLQIM